ncbi:MAG: zinc ribbon domain-containing protein [Nocardioidaceae bacterium]
MQSLDSGLTALAHRKRSLPQNAQLAELAEKRSNVARQAVEFDTDVADLNTAQRKADADVEQVRQRRTRTQQRLDAGQVSSPRELESLQHELGTLDRRIGVLEDEELEVMQRLETAATSLDAAHTEMAAIDDAVVAEQKALDEAVAGIDDEASGLVVERERVSASVPEPLLALYAKLREQMGGVGAAPLHQRRCEGCRLEINSADLRDIAAAAPDEVLRCPECNRILIRTSESGV